MERSKRPRLLILDIDGVLYDYDRDERVRVLAELLGCPTSAVDDALYASGIEDRADEGALTTEQYLSAVGNELDRTLDRATWVQARVAATRPMRRELALAETAAALTTVVTLSNNSLLLKEEMPTVMPELVAVPGLRIHVAAELGALKPNPAVYRRLVDLHGVEPRDAAFVDDAERHVRGAIAAGLQAVHYEGYEQLADWFASHDLVPG